MSNPSFLLFSEPHIVIPREYREEILSSFAHPKRMVKKLPKGNKLLKIPELPTLPTIPKTQ